MKTKRTVFLARIEAEKKRGKVNVQRFKGLGEMNPLQLLKPPWILIRVV